MSHQAKVDQSSARDELDDSGLGERERLLRSGWSTLRANGYANASIAEILTSARLGTRAFYRHFASKDELLVEMFRGSAHVTERQVATAAEGPATAVEQVLAWVDAMLDLGYDPRHAEMAKMFASPIFTEVGNEVKARLRSPLGDALTRGIVSGELSGDPDSDAITIHAIVWELLLDAISGHPRLDRVAARRQVERFVLPVLRSS